MIQRELDGRFSNLIVCGRRVCSGPCGRWRHILDFPPRRIKSGPRKGEISGVEGWCHYCRRVRSRTSSLSAEELRRRRATNRAHMRKARRKAGVPEGTVRKRATAKYTSVPREPFARWISPKIKQLGIMEVSRRTGVPDRTFRALLRGYDFSGKAKRKWGKRTKLRQVDYVDFELVDRCFMAFDEEHLLKDFYPIPHEDAKPSEATVYRQKKRAEDTKVEMIGVQADVPNVIGEYQRRRRARHPRSG